MAVAVEIPNLGEAMEGGVVAEWYVEDGARVQAGDAVCRVECSFVAVDVEAGRPGLLRHRKPAGSIERPGVVLGLILEAGEAMPPDAALRRTTSNRQAAEAEPQGEGEDQQEFEDALVEAVVVPFPGRFAGTKGHWESAPGDSVVFDSSLFGESVADRTEGLPEPGGDIPGLPLWEPPPADLPATEAPASMAEALSLVSASAERDSEVLSVAVAVDLAESGRLCRAVARRGGGGEAPVIEDVVLLAILTCLPAAGAEPGVGSVVIAGELSDVAYAVAQDPGQQLKTLCALRCGGGNGEIETARWSLTSLRALGARSAVAELRPGAMLAFCLCAEQPDGDAELSLRFRSGQLSLAGGARLLAKVRDLIESPYAMLV